MLFNSHVFILLFLPVCLIGYFGLNHLKQYTSAKAFLLGMSFWFYGYFHAFYLLLLAGSILGNYLFYRLLRRALLADTAVSKRTAKGLMLTGVILNLAVLGVFKYTDFFLDTINAVFRNSIPLPGLLLPLGISFFTFQQLGFLVDTYRGEAGEYRFLDYALFISFFPQLIAGPIVRHDELIPQFADIQRKKWKADYFSAGCVSFIAGLSKKILIADVMGRAVTYGYENLQTLDSVSALVVMLAFYFQIYFDFSGYSDMAIGLGKMLNLDLPVNFLSPYRAVTVREYWKRWHMTLTRFFTAYVYIPLGGSRQGLYRTCRNILIVFLLSGIWHGAGWGFIVWGLLNGMGIVLCRLFEKPLVRMSEKKFSAVLLWILNALFINLTWVFFQAEHLSTAAAFFKRLFAGGIRLPAAGFLETFRSGEFWYTLKLLHLDRGGYGDIILCSGYLLAALGIVLLLPNVHTYLKKWQPSVRSALLFGILFVWSFVSLSEVSVFLYYNF